MIMNLIASLCTLLIKRYCIEPMIKSIESNDFILEIGGGYNPLFPRNLYPNVYHLDHCNTESLKAKYSADENVAHLVHRIQQIDFIFDGSPIETLIPQTLRFDYIYSAHALEHQVDLVGHFRSIEKILKPDGKVILVIPDHRACFDCLRFPTVTSDVVPVHLRKQSIHQGKQVYEALAQCLNINPGRQVNRFDLLSADFSHSLKLAYNSVCASEMDTTNYCDVHAWTFTPLSFQLLLIELYLLDMTFLRLERLSPTYGNQFCAVLSQSPEIGRENIKKYLERDRLRLSKKLYARRFVKDVFL